MRSVQSAYERAWRKFVETGRQDEVPENEIIRSWRRSREAGVDPLDGEVVRARLPEARLKELLAR